MYANDYARLPIGKPRYQQVVQSHKIIISSHYGDFVFSAGYLQRRKTGVVVMTPLKFDSLYKMLDNTSYSECLSISPFFSGTRRMVTILISMAAVFVSHYRLGEQPDLALIDTI